MLDRKGIPFKRVDLMPVISKGVLKALRFDGITVPALKIDGKRIQGSREIARELDRVRPEPPLFPSDPDARAKVEEAERWGDEVFQGQAASHHLVGAEAQPRPLASYSEERAARRAGRPGRQDGSSDRRRGGEAQPRHRRERARRPRGAARGPRPHRRLDRRGRARRRTAERGRHESRPACAC